MAPPRLVLLPGLDGTGLLFQPFLQAWRGPAAADAIVPPRCAAHLRRTAPRAAWREFPGPHLLLQTRPADAAAAIAAFLEKIE